VGSFLGNLGADSGFFKTILPFIESNNIKLHESNIGENRPYKIIFDLENGELYELKTNAKYSDPIHSITFANPTSKSLIKETTHNDYNYYLSSNDDGEMVKPYHVSPALLQE
ncbi:hypothetical protein VII00023_06969, partial [Vibrio ichthyoenteri ATCC 700023]